MLLCFFLFVCLFHSESAKILWYDACVHCCIFKGECHNCTWAARVFAAAGHGVGTQSELVQLIPSSLAVVIVTFVFCKHPLPCESHEVVHFPLKTLFRCCGVCLYKLIWKLYIVYFLVQCHHCASPKGLPFLPAAARFHVLPPLYSSCGCYHFVSVRRGQSWRWSDQVLQLLCQ